MYPFSHKLDTQMEAAWINLINYFLSGALACTSFTTMRTNVSGTFAHKQASDLIDAIARIAQGKAG